MELSQVIFTQDGDRFINGWYLERFYSKVLERLEGISPISLSEEVDCSEASHVHSRGLILWES